MRIQSFSATPVVCILAVSLSDARSEVRCDRGYTAHGDLDCQDGQWSQPACAPESCAAPPLTDHAEGGANLTASCGALRSPKGHVLAHSSALMHGGHPTTRGVRYILVAFCTIAPEYADWASRFYEHVNERVDPGEEQAFAPRSLPLGMLTAGPVYRQARQASLEGDRA